MRPPIALIGALVSAFVLGCAQVPKESVELSTAVGRDIAVAHKAHRATAEILYERMKDDINDFVDTVYAPYQIRKTLQTQRQRATDPTAPSLFRAMANAASDSATDADARTAYLMMQVYVEELREEIESYRAKLLEPIAAQEQEVIASIDRTYQQMHHANSIVTGHLASVRKVHDAQEELLNEIGIAGLREEVGTKVAVFSKKIGGFVQDAHRLRGTAEEVDARIGELATDFREIVQTGTATTTDSGTTTGDP